MSGDDEPANSPTGRTLAGMAGLAFASLLDRDCRLLILGTACSGVGTWVQRVALNWLVLTTTGSVAMVGLTVACQWVPSLLLGVPAGALVDRTSRRRVALASQIVLAVLALTLGVIVLAGHVRLWHIIVIALLSGVCVAVDGPARTALLNDLAEARGVLRNAISLNHFAFQASAIVGPLVGGLVMATTNIGFAFVINATSYLGTIAALVVLRAAPAHRLVPAAAGAWRIGERIREIRTRRHAAWPLALVAVFGLVAPNLPVVLSAFADSVWHSDATGYSVATTVVGAGGMVGALVTGSARRPARLRGLAVIAGGLGLAMVAASMAGEEALFLVVMGGVGLLYLCFLATTQSMVQASASREERGRFSAVFLTVHTGAAAIGGPLVGLLVQGLGARVGLALCGVVPTVAVFVVAAALARESKLRLRIEPGVRLPRVIAVRPSRRIDRAGRGV